jgi:hypothetical protein
MLLESPDLARRLATYLEEQQKIEKMPTGLTEGLYVP